MDRGVSGVLLPLIVHAADSGAHEAIPYAHWSAALDELRCALEQGSCLAPEELPQFLARIASDDVGEVLMDLVAIHMHHAWGAGRPTPLEDYVTVLGQHSRLLASTRVLPADLVEDEFLVRHTLPGGDMPPLTEYDRRFAGRREVLAPLEKRILRGGRYVKVGRLGRGGMGVVWSACDRQLGQMVAIKEPHPDHECSSELTLRFLAEAELAARLDHPGIVRVHEIASDASPPWFVMDRVRGVSLADRIRELHHPEVFRTRRETRALRRDLLHCMVEVARATAHAHERGVLHRDLKPGNVVVRDTGQAVILDWGTAAIIGATAAMGAGAEFVVGTPESMAPEQARGVADERSDVFGIGAILFELLTGGQVHAWANGERPADWRQTVAQGLGLTELRRLSGFSRALGDICRKALSRDPADRHPSAEALADEIAEQLDKTGSALPFVGAIGRFLVRRDRRMLRKIETHLDIG